jgi:hypothetical protein
VLSIPGIAVAAGQSYTGGNAPGTGPTGGATTAPGFTTILTTQTIQPSGGSVSASSGGSTVSVTIPAGALTTPAQITLSTGSPSGLSGLPSGASPIVALGVSIDVNGSKYTGTFNSPITVTISNPGITTADQLLVYDPASGSYVSASQASNVANVTVSAGKITLQILSDPYVVVSAATGAAATTAVTGATSATTGVPVLAEVLGGAGLLAVGILLIWRLRRSSNGATGVSRSN